MSDVHGFSRDQMSFQILSLDEMIEKENPVRAIDAFVESLCLAEMGIKEYKKHNPGQQPYERKDLLKLFIYGYFNKIRSSRSLETECKRNLELMWLVNGIRPDHGTISLFLKENRKGFKKIMRTFTCLLKGWGLIDGKLIAIDGTKIREQNSKRNYITPNGLTKKMKYMDEKIEHYLQKLEETAQEDELMEETVSSIESKIDTYKKKKENLTELKKKMIEEGKNQLTTTDPESRAMKNNGKIDVAYNMQSSVDNKHKLIVTLDVVNDVNDQSQLTPMVSETNKILSKNENRIVLADTGYYNAKEIKECLDDGNILYLKPQKNKSTSGDPTYSKDNFQYQKETDTYRCPQGKELPYKENTSKNGMKYKRYKGGDICLSCPVYNLCTKAKTGRNIQRWEHEELLEKLKEDTEANNATYKKRSQIVEHPFGTIKRSLGYTFFLGKGLDSVNAEAALIGVAYNFKRLTKIKKVSEIVKLLVA
ncbi:IS1182 family transposase [Virgibacillus dokdonensis]|uniref:IS1182 family transposase n=1 Tax=Virgibacillus dokdonensis TaxID=302167 RepID=UPI00098BC8E9|nr:IS1182 family transposase [Virgibacillus dokdonensis]